jgi:hypothetical protein
LAVEQQQRSGDPVGEIDGVVVREPGEQRGSFGLAGGGASLSAAGRDAQCLGVAASRGPVEEVADVVGGRAAAGQSEVDGVLVEIGQGGAAVV